MELAGNIKKRIESCEDIVGILQSLNKSQFDEIDRDKEKLIVVHLDCRNKVISIDMISMGVVDGCCIHPRETFRKAIALNAVKIILAHNHPSGEPEPSDVDKEITMKLCRAGKVLSIEVVDHIVFTDNHYYSFKEAGKIN